VMVMDLAGAIGENSAFADEVDQIQVSASREIGLATRELLQERAKRLSAALDRLNEGAYGVCVECTGPIAPARLEAVPEVETCVRCQAGLERLGRQSVSSRTSVFVGVEDEEEDRSAT
jgi:RNA polymerase-binding transcription factor DksA